MNAADSSAIGQVAFDVQLVGQDLRLAGSRTRRPTEKEAVAAAERRLADMTALDALRALIEWNRLTGSRFRI